MNVWLSSGSTHLWHLGETKPATDWEAQIDQLMQKQISTGPQCQKATNLERNHNCVICTDQDGEAVIMEAVARTVSALSLRASNKIP
jgi:hypothetical protein